MPSIKFSSFLTENSVPDKSIGLNMFAPTRTLLHTYNRHDHHHHHHHHHHIMIMITLKFATPSEQDVHWGININFIFMMGQNSSPPLTNMLIGVITSTISP